MPKQDLKKKLKAADRRRKRRSAAPGENALPAQRRRVDVSGLIALAILEHADSSKSEVRDAAVISTLRQCLKGGMMGNKTSQALYERLEQISLQTGVDRRDFRGALQQMLMLAQQCRDTKNSSAFIQYIGILTS